MRFQHRGSVSSISSCVSECSSADSCRSAVFENTGHICSASGAWKKAPWPEWPGGRQK
ncbi:MAG: PAN domain-containing protein [Lachnospiraceae bacterium]